ncbi:hypothetical protein COU58_04150 [Candidatus Pacearchaeota archaeon CG10_big_fil_rev_8_21_14_0_10_32_42]|nr:MAG: hypothetical protein COU58_04150 [Candidatus Pacearchaeota archaeon CG10_big_fil_rev_8_21_14_0_10_32_42]
MKKVKKIKGPEILISLVFYFVGIALINIFSKGVNPKLILNPILAIEFLSFQISFLLEMSNFLTLAIGFLLTLVPLIFGYIISKEFFMKNELF